jgi:hypothetical protein
MDERTDFCFSAFFHKAKRQNHNSIFTIECSGNGDAAMVTSEETPYYYFISMDTCALVST